MRCPLFLTAAMYFVYFDFLSVPCCWPFPPPSSLLVSVVSLDLIYCRICSFRPHSFFFRYQLCARWWACEGCLIYSGVKSRPRVLESSAGCYSVNVCMCLNWLGKCVKVKAFICDQRQGCVWFSIVNHNHTVVIFHDRSQVVAGARQGEGVGVSEEPPATLHLMGNSKH